jgi:hypothetical protein
MEVKKGLAIGMGVAGLAGLALWMMNRSASAEPEEPEEPEEGLANLYGRVRDSDTGNGIVGVRVTTTGAITETDSAGDYLASDIPPGQWEVLFEKDGYEPQTHIILLEEGNNQLNVQLVSTGGETPEEGINIPTVSVSPNQLTVEKHEYNTSVGLGYWGDPFTIEITFNNPNDFDVWVKPDFAFGHVTGEALEVGDGEVQGFTPEEMIYFRLILTGSYEGDYSYTTKWQKPYDAKGQNTGSPMAFVYDPDGVPRAGDERWVLIPAGGSITFIKDCHLGDDLSQKAYQCVLCGEIIEGGVEDHYAENHPGVGVTCWSWGGWSGCYFDDGSGDAVTQVYVPKPGIEGYHDLCVVAWRAIYFVYDPGCGQTRVGGEMVTLNWRLEELPPLAGVVENMIEIVD